jgi:hypothetical protein
MSEPTVVTLPDPAACALAAAERIIEILDVAIDDRGEAHWVTTGGSAPGAIYEHLASEPLRGELDWRKVRLWFTDERFVPLDHNLSNAKIAFDRLLDAGAFGGMSGRASRNGRAARPRSGRRDPQRQRPTSPSPMPSPGRDRTGPPRATWRRSAPTAPTRTTTACPPST